jgi:1,4-dihydroxy-2-naphthoate octaprenyltransferase
VGVAREADLTLIGWIKDFLRQSRALFLTCTLVPVAFGGALAYHDTLTFDPVLFLLCLLGVCLAHLGVNLANDYYDFRLGADRREHDERPYSGGGSSITRDDVPPAKVRQWFMTCFLAGLAVGMLILFLMPKGQGVVLAITFLGFLGGYFYTAPPARLAYRGLGEFDIFLFLGPMPALGTYAVLTGTIGWRVVWLSFPIAGLITLLLWINQYTDYESDKTAGKKNLVVRLGLKHARWGYLLLNLFVFGVAVWAVRADLIGEGFLLVMLALPLSIRSVYRAVRYYDVPEKIRAAQADALMLHLGAGLLCSVGAVVSAAL